MSSPSELHYTREHEWARLEGDGTLTIGVTDHAQDALGDVVFVELPEVGETLGANDKFGVVESVKTVSDLFLPCGGEVVAINDALEATPEKVNEDPYGDGWIIRLKLSDSGELDGLLSSSDYDAFVVEEG